MFNPIASGSFPEIVFINLYKEKSWTFLQFELANSCLRLDTALPGFYTFFALDSHPYNYDRISTMKKAWIYRRKSIKGWYESGKRKAKALPSKELAEHYKHIKYTQLNSDVFTGQVLADWNQMVAEYREAKKVQGVTESTLYEIALSLRNFERFVGKCNSKQITQNVIDKFILQRGSKVKRSTPNKDIRNLKTFVNWCREHRYLNGSIKIKELKEDERPVKSLNDAQVKKLMSIAEPYRSIKMRILLALGTGLRRGDIETLKVDDIDFANNYITTTSRKTRKSIGSRPVSTPVMAELRKFVNGSSAKQIRLFNNNFSHKRWKKICEEAYLKDLKFHDLRKTFGSLLAQNGISTAVTQRFRGCWSTLRQH